MNGSELQIDGWTTDLLDKLAERGSGHTPNKKHPEYWNGGIKWVSLADSAKLDKIFISETEKEISRLGIDNSSATVHPKGTVILSRDAGVGKSAILAQDMAVSQHFMAWRCNGHSKIESLFLYYWLQMMKPEFERIAIGSTIKTIGLPYFKKLRVTYPISIAEQRKIAEILSCWDEGIWCAEWQIRKLELLKATIIKKLICQVDTNGTKTRQLGELGEVITGNTPNTRDEQNFGGSFPFVTPGDLGNNKYIFQSNRYLSERGFTKCRALPKGAVLFCCIGSTIGKIGIASRDLATNQQINSIIPSQEIDSEFLYYALLSKAEQIRNLAGVQAVPIVNKSTFASICIRVPPRDLQRQSVHLLITTDRYLEKLNTFKIGLTTQKQALMQKLLTGRIRVRV